MATPTPAPTSPASTAAALASGRHGGFLLDRARVAPGCRSALRAQPAAAELVERSVNTIRFLAVDAVEKAKSGHPGLPMGCAPLGHVLFDEFLRFNPANHAWFDRDRFVLSAGHGCMLQYALLHLAGYQGVTIDDLKAFRQWGSRTPGHPENFETDGVEVTTGLPLEHMFVEVTTRKKAVSDAPHMAINDDLKAFRQWGSRTPGHPENFETDGVEVTTGPLGQGFANAVGLALAEKHLAARFNKPDLTVVDHYTYVILGDGCQMEGVANEAASLAGHWGLGKLIAFYDDNHISIDGSTGIAFTEDVLARYESLGWHTIWVENGNTGYDDIRAAIKEAKEVKEKPTLIKELFLICWSSPPSLADVGLNSLPPHVSPILSARKTGLAV